MAAHIEPTVPSPPTNDLGKSLSAISATNRRSSDELLGLVAGCPVPRRETVPLNEVSYENGGFIVGREIVSVDEKGLRQLCSSFQAPVHYVLSRDVELRDRLIANHVQTASDRFPNGVTVVIDESNNTFQGLLRPDLVSLTPTEITLATLDGLENNAESLQVTRCKLDGRTFSFDLVLNQATLALDFV